MLRQKFTDDFDLLAFLSGEFKPPGLLVQGMGFLPLFYHFGKDFKNLFIGHRVMPLTARGDVAVLDSRKDEPQRRGATFILCLDGGFERRIDLRPHGMSPSRECRCEFGNRT